MVDVNLRNPEHERRRSRRYTRSFTAFFRAHSNKARLAATVVDLSNEGICLEISSECSEGQGVGVNFFPDKNSPLSAEATVRWTQACEGGRSRVGLEFTHMTRSDRARLHRLLAPAASNSEIQGAGARGALPLPDEL